MLTPTASNKEKIIFLDLEETLILSWYDPIVLSVDFIKELLRNEGTSKVHIFSFAIANDTDKKTFELYIKKHIESHFDIEVLSWMSVDEIMREVYKHNRIVLERYEFTTMWGKLKAFHDFCNVRYANSDCVLVDDDVPNSTFSLPDKNLIIRTIQVPK